MLGRPKKYTEPRIPITITLPEWKIKEINEICRKNKITRTEFLTAAIIVGLGDENGKT